MAPKIGFIGMGIMGQPMAENILKSGYELMAYNRTKEKAQALTDKGGIVVSTPAELTEWADVIILMLTGPEAIDAVLYAEQGILSAQPADKIIINMSTVSPSYTRNLKKCLEPSNISFIDAPVSGSKKPAIEGSLIILAGGEADQINALEPLFLTMGKKVIYCGEAGKGSAMKMTINLLLALMIEGLCESLNLAQLLNLDTDLVLDSILAGHLGCGLFNLKSDMLKQNDFPVQFPLKHMTKDLRFVLQTADEAGAAVPAGHAVYQLYRQGVGLGNGDLDFAAVKRTLEALNDQ
ncbi:MAG: NAD(P)-dependent oxidoreductase [Deltaproteobacteria bacterium]|nr:MAG: NAD(P)-dependent oxidoreductase [Deltaproteobacteria bacterium]